ncbi:hypothetical protein HPC49_00335 [Pyxidicoccus fallax]|uniref:Peptidase metallopeptidase domain-containing protein n=1 Tax=Pyxidicoccus fallax TaxID=394095 RepID=A0A848L5S6_9BACT|nr:FG-GAP-like repeat-containing protein [Pyxidicoccus fallax]NMO13966.1 hypothetical protein [Pyxidicoccus fallax]NPC76702.1 hypothetical protein [Pyxidicoccus fallax]
MTGKRVVTLFATTALLGLGCGPEQQPAPEAAPPQSLTWEEFRARVFQEPETGAFITNGDEKFATEAQLREYYEAHVRTPELGQARGELAVMFRNGARARWSDAQKRNITYCVSTAFGSRHAQVVAAMAGAAGEWEAAADIDFVHVSGLDGSCTASQTSVVFDVNPINVGSYLARAFFPDDVRAARNVLIDNSSFGSLPPGLTLQGILRHELGHTLGFRHEHTRPEAGTCFEDNQWQALTGYDRNSTMHYPQCNGSGSWVLALTALDRAGAASLYGARRTRGTEFDFDGDRRADLAVWRRPGAHWWIQYSSTGGSGVQQWGLDDDRIVPADYTDDGRTDMAVWRPSEGIWYILDSATGGWVYAGAHWGLAGDIPVPVDYTGDGRAELAVWRPSEGNWYVFDITTGAPSIYGVQWGLPGDVPVPADYTGDGRADLAVWRPSEGNWYVFDATTGVPFIYGAQLGMAGDIPVPADYDGDGRTDLAVWRPSTGFWHVIRSGTGAAWETHWGLPDDVPVPADYDGDGRTDLAVWRPSTGHWYYLRSSDGASAAPQWGSQANGDIPVKAYR